jgi:diguanylate cyclase (GGDEF)-like protein
MRDVATVSDQRAVRGAPGNRIVTWTWFVAVGAAVTFGYYVLPHLGVPREAQSIIFILTSTIAALTVLAGVVINKPAGRLPWLVLAGAQGMYSIGDTIYYVLHTVLQRDQYPDLADVFYLAQYPLICLALVIFIRRRTPGRDTIALIDAAVVAVAGGLLSWVYVISKVANNGESPLAGAVSVAYPMMDVLVLAVALRLMLGAGSRSGAYRLLIASLTLQLIADVLYALTIDTYQDGSLIDGLWFGAYILLGAAALHPSMRSLDRRSARTAINPTRGRLMLLATASLLPLVILVVQHLRKADTHIFAVAVAGGVMFLLVLARMAEQVSEQRELAIRDGLTGAYTAEFLTEALRTECDRARYARGQLAIVLVDVDNIKLINEMYGQTGGDLVLREMAERLRIASRPGDLVGRHSEDKFVVLLAGADPRLAAQVAERMREALSASHIPIGDEARVRATASIGLATMPADGSTPHDLLHGADQALFAAKRAGRNRTFTRHGPAAEPVVGFPMMDRGSWSAPAPRVASDPSELPRWGGR